MINEYNHSLLPLQPPAESHRSPQGLHGEFAQQVIDYRAYKYPKGLPFQLFIRQMINTRGFVRTVYPTQL